MVNPNDLRIGNYVIRKQKMSKVTGIFEDEILVQYQEEDSIFDFPSNVDSIQLTPEILEKAGFSKDFIDACYPEEGSYYSLRLNNEKYCDLSILSGDKNGFTEITLFPYQDWFRYKYLHQLQNIYYTLTAHELTITL